MLRFLKIIEQKHKKKMWTQSVMRNKNKIGIHAKSFFYLGITAKLDDCLVD